MNDRGEPDRLASQPGEVGDLFDDARLELLLPVPEEIERSHLAMIAEATRAELTRPTARVATPATWRRIMRTGTAFGLKVGVAALTLAVSTLGLAYAGVDLPGTAAERALEAVLPVELPNQGVLEAAGSSQHGSDVSSFASDPNNQRGCEFGQAVADLADDRSEEVRQNPTPGPTPCSEAEAAGEVGEPVGSRATGEGGSAEGKANKAGAEGNSDEGKANADANKTEAGERAGQGQEHGEEQSEEGGGHKPEDPGAH